MAAQHIGTHYPQLQLPLLLADRFDQRSSPVITQLFGVAKSVAIITGTVLVTTAVACGFSFLGIAAAVTGAALFIIAHDLRELHQVLAAATHLTTVIEEIDERDYEEEGLSRGRLSSYEQRALDQTAIEVQRQVTNAVANSLSPFITLFLCRVGTVARQESEATAARQEREAYEEEMPDVEWCG